MTNVTNDKSEAECACKGAGPALSQWVNRLGPPAARDHFRSARVEFLKGVRALIDARIERISKAGHSTAGTTVPIE